MPIAVLDSVHILSEVHDHYRKHDSMRSTVRHVLHELFTPMTLTSLTTFVGFIALIATPIPPVQVFGAFVALGVFFAWILSLTFNPAFAVLLPAKSLANFGAVHEGHGAPESHLQRFMTGARRYHTPILITAVIALAVAGVGITKIRVNDNPVHWFKANHPLRIAEQRLGSHLAGTYMAYLELKSPDDDAFLDPELLAWTEALQTQLQEHANVGGVSSVVDIVKKIRWELSDGAEGSDQIPDSQEAVAQLLFLYEIGGGDPEDLFRLITPEYDAVNLWVQMVEGENRQVSDLMKGADRWIAANPAPSNVEAHWGGLSAINVVWQERMVAGMGKALAGSYITVLLMMMLLFRSVRLGIAAMLPLTLTIAVSYGFIGWIGRDYDMPTAVLSSLSLGLSIDFAIHFLQRSREIQRRTGNLKQTMAEFFGSPAQALARNIVVIALGFIPMFFAPLVPYVTVGAFFFAIMWISGAATLILLPAILSITPERVLAGRGFERSSTMKTTAAAALLLMLGTSYSTGAQAQESMSAEQIAAKAHLNMYYAAEDGIAQVDMQITDKRGKSRERRFSMLRKDIEDGGEQRYFVYFQRPRDVQRTTFMVWKDPSADDARWIYVPALDLVKPISANDKRSSFVGSDFSYEDVSGRHWSQDEHELLREDVLDGHPVYVIQSTPKSDDGFATKLSFIDRERLLPLREEYHDDKGELIKLFEALEIKDIDGVLTITKRRMSTPPKGSATEITFESIQYDVGIDAELFRERTLKNPPRDLIES
jgi:outer membrane lipoprotein-sorting protein/preprotein translocase subunit SecF